MYLGLKITNSKESEIETLSVKIALKFLKAKLTALSICVLTKFTLYECGSRIVVFR